MDLLLGGTLVILASPLFVLCWVAVRLTSPGPALHWSRRVGRDNRLFGMPKFRTMHINAPQMATHLLERPERYMTPIGALLRKTSLDELPQLFSVWSGDLTLVGPRPALFNQNDLVELRTRHGVHRLVPESPAGRRSMAAMICQSRSRLATTPNTCRRSPLAWTRRS
jgi:O-antigen biosynthesis protein WbqP